MSRPVAESARSTFSVGARALAVTGVYIAAAVAVLLTVIVLRGQIAPASLRGVLGFVFVATLAAGLEPGTVKAAALGEAGVKVASLGAFLGAGALKAILVSPILAVLWRFADPAADVAMLIWTPLIAIAGFGATDLRVLLDLRGRHALAIGLKQGSLAGGVVLLGLLVACGVPLFWAIGVSTLARVALLAIAPLSSPESRPFGMIWREARALLADGRWLDLAAVSVIAAAGGSTDRMFGLRYLAPAVYGGYYLTYELLTKFWLLPYVLSPILFAREAAGEDSRGFARGAWGLTAAAGAGFLVVVAGLLLITPGLFTRVIGASFGLATLGFAGAVVIGSFGQLRLARLQGSGRSRQAAAAMALSAAVSVPLFFVAARTFGARGLLLAWLVKALVELAALMWGGWRGLVAKPL